VSGSSTKKRAIHEVALKESASLNERCSDVQTHYSVAALEMHAHGMQSARERSTCLPASDIVLAAGTEVVKESDSKALLQALFGQLGVQQSGQELRHHKLDMQNSMT